MSREAENTIRGLRREGEQYRVAGMLDRLALVNQQLVALGADPLDEPKAVVRQSRQSAQASTRKKRSAD